LRQRCAAPRRPFLIQPYTVESGTLPRSATSAAETKPVGGRRWRRGRRGLGIGACFVECKATTPAAQSSAQPRAGHVAACEDVEQLYW
jgi:hypothetical protein